MRAGSMVPRPQRMSLLCHRGADTDGPPSLPLATGQSLSPTTGDFVVNVSGSRTAVDTANVKGVNDVLASINLFTNTLNQKVQANKMYLFNFPGQTATTLATENVYPLITPGYRIETAPGTGTIFPRWNKRWRLSTRAMEPVSIQLPLQANIPVDQPEHVQGKRSGLYRYRIDVLYSACLCRFGPHRMP